MGSEVGILWIVLAFIAVGIFYLFWIAGDKLTPKNSPLTGKPRTPEQINKKSFNKAIILIILAIFLMILVF